MTIGISMRLLCRSSLRAEAAEAVPRVDRRLARQRRHEPAGGVVLRVGELDGALGVDEIGAPDAAVEQRPAGEHRRGLAVAHHVGPGAAVFSIDRVGCCRDRPVEWCHTVVRADRFALSASFGPGTGFRLGADSWHPRSSSG